MATTDTDTRTVAQLCSDLVADHFDNHPFEAFSLESFTAPTGKGLLADLQSTASIPRDPSCTRMHLPSLLLYDLQNDRHKCTEVYKFIDETNDICSGLYGTSGAGKTRAVYEYLSHNFGLYFVAKTANDPGSKDLSRLVGLFRTLHAPNFLGELDGGDSQSQHDENQQRQRQRNKSDVNQRTMDRYIGIMIYVRIAVFDAINKQLKEKENTELTPYDWLLIQLFPRETMKKDLFPHVCGGCIRRAFSKPEDGSVTIALVDRNQEEVWPWTTMVVDEAQVLLRQLTDFFLGSKGDKKRHAFSAVLKAMSNTLTVALDSDTGFPLVAGTDMSIDVIRESSDSVMTKRPHTLLENRTTIFKAFRALDAEAVQAYLLIFINLDLEEPVEEGKVSNASVIGHVSKWLRGRPRWAATFLELYFVRERRNDYTGTRGSFSAEGGLLIQALDRYLDNYAEDTIGNLDALGGDRRKSFDPREGTAYSGFKHAVDEGGHPVGKVLENAIFKFAVGGKPVFISEYYAALIQVGVAALSTQANMAVLDEPIVIQAGVNFFSLQAAVIDNMVVQELGGHGDGFEKAMLPAIQNRLPGILEEQLGDKGDVLKKYMVPHRSAYGMLAVKCDHASETINWIEATTNSTFEGQVAPFCYPDTGIGPDLMFMMWNDSYTDYVAVISQAKYRNQVNQMDALRSVTPALLYHKNRDKDPKLSTGITSNNGLKRRWEEVQPKLVGEKFGCVRLIVQYPCDHTATAKSGVLEDEQVKVTESESEENPSKKQKKGWLATISQSNASKLFDRYGLEVLNALKGGGAS